VIPTSTIQETVYVLERLYHLDAAAIAPKLISLLTIPNVDSPDAGWIVEALQLYRAKNSDFGDALLCACARAQGCDVATFDKGIVKKLSEVAVPTPTGCLSRKAQGKHKGEQN
jgi:predicted nucleic-acid-binding protein